MQNFIIMTGSSPRLILEGKKTQTRRVMKPQPVLKPGTMKSPTGQPIDTAYWHWGNKWWWQDPQQSTLDLCPYGQPGDRLWVRETWTALFNNDDGMILWWHDTPKEQRTKDRLAGPVYYRAEYKPEPDDEWPWVPSIFMYRWASRITLKLTGVRVERLQEISEADCFSEGAVPPGVIRQPIDPISLFRNLWDAINLKRGFGWDSNPWVWVLNFRVQEVRGLLR